MAVISVYPSLVYSLNIICFEYSYDKIGTDTIIDWYAVVVEPLQKDVNLLVLFPTNPAA